MPTIYVKPSVINFTNNRERVKVKVVADYTLASATISLPSWITATGLSGSTLTLTGNKGYFYVEPTEGEVNQQYNSAITITAGAVSTSVIAVWYRDAEYISINEIVNDLDVLRTDTCYYSDVPRRTLLLHAQRGVQSMAIESFSRPRFKHYILDDTGRITKPFDMIKLIKAHWVDSIGKLHDIYVNDKLNYSWNYKLDSNNALILDQAGYPILTSNTSPKYTNNSDVYFTDAEIAAGSRTVINAGKSTAGQYSIDYQGNNIVFSNVPSEHIVLEYISDPLLDSQLGDGNDLRVPRMYRQALENYIYWKSVSRKPDIPKNELMYAEKEYYNEYRKARLHSINYADIVSAIKVGRNPLKW